MAMKMLIGWRNKPTVCQGDEANQQGHAGVTESGIASRFCYRFWTTRRSKKPARLLLLLCIALWLDKRLLAYPLQDRLLGI